MQRHVTRSIEIIQMVQYMTHSSGSETVVRLGLCLHQIITRIDIKRPIGGDGNSCGMLQ